jgi:hypothetical protein
VRFLAPNFTVSPNNGTNPVMGTAIDKVFVPPLEMRDMNNAQSEGSGNEPWSVAVGDNGQEFGDTEKKAGGGVLYAAPPGAVHTSFALVPPSLFNNKSGHPDTYHPEWFGPGQLCWLAPGLKEHLAKRVPARAANSTCPGGSTGPLCTPSSRTPALVCIRTFGSAARPPAAH